MFHRDRVPALVSVVVLTASALVVVSTRGPSTPVDRLFPWLLLLAGLISGGRFRERGALIGLIALAGWILSPDPMTRGLVVGAMWGGSMLSLGLAVVTRFEGAAVVAMAIAPFRLLGATTIEDLSVAIIVMLGAAAIVLCWPFIEENRPAGLTGAMSCAALAGLVSPVFPLRSALVPLTVAASLLVIPAAGKARLIREAVAVGLALATGIWAVLLVVICIVFLRMPDRRERARSEPLAVVSPAASLASGWWSLVPFFGTAAWPPGRAWVPLAIGMAVAAISRPAVALASVVIGGTLTIAIGSRTDAGAEKRLLPLAALAVLVVALFPWSGAVISGFPFVTVWPVVLAVAAILAAPLAGRASAVLVAVVFFSTVYLHGFDQSTGGDVFASLGPGQSLSFHRDANRAGPIVVDLSAGNMSDRKAGEVVGVIDLVGGDGQASRREVRMGDLADWGAFRGRSWYRTFNPVPRRPAGRIEGWGIASFRRGTGRIVLEKSAPVELISIEAAADLDPEEELIIEGVRFR